ncbi:MAG: hypothetical protein JRJ03_05135 [Deltaproteobacteria bacterium]|nr:hypothetical protein [Deltaproteobacteria bacterium]
MSIKIEKHILENACKEMIETALLCLPNAFKGTIYLIGSPPELVAKRIASGVIDEAREQITWGLPANSEYNPPGIPWNQYRDEPGRPLEAIAWCVEKQKSWTAQDPNKDLRKSVLEENGQGFHHLEPVLLRKSDISINMYSPLEYPRTYEGDIIWKESEYLVVAVIKIHFKPYTIKVNSHETRVIKKLSRSLGTELLSYQLRQDSMDALQKMTLDRLNACNILADSLRNAITKSALIFSLVKQEIGQLRREWEGLLLDGRKECRMKQEAVEALNSILVGINGDREVFRDDLIQVQNRFLEMSLPPEKGENWITMQIEKRWKDLLQQIDLGQDKAEEVWVNIEKLKRSLHVGKEPSIVNSYNSIPEELKREWIDLIYMNTERYDPSLIERIINVLSDPALQIPSRERSRKTLTRLKALAETMNHLERNTNFLLNQVLTGESTQMAESVLNRYNRDNNIPVKEDSGDRE